MYGYDPGKPVRQGSWRETLIFVQAAFEVILPLIGVFMAIVAAVIVTIGLVMIDIRLAVIPAAAVAVILYVVYRRDRRLAAEERARIDRIPH